MLEDLQNPYRRELLIRSLYLPSEESIKIDSLNKHLPKYFEQLIDILGTKLCNQIVLAAPFMSEKRAGKLLIESLFSKKGKKKGQARPKGGRVWVFPKSDGGQREVVIR